VSLSCFHSFKLMTLIDFFFKERSSRDIPRKETNARCDHVTIMILGFDKDVCKNGLRDNMKT